MRKYRIATETAPLEGWIDSPLGRVVVSLTEQGVTSLRIEAGIRGAGSKDIPNLALWQVVRSELEEYFAGMRRDFSVPVVIPREREFASAVLRSLQQVPYGSTVTYGGLATLAGRPGAARAVGRVMAMNPVPILLPCHRVLGAGGCLTGYSGGEGLATKEWLLDFEQRSS